MLKNYQSFLRKKNTKTSHKLSMVEKVSNVSSNNSLYSETKKFENFLSQKNVKIAKRAHAFKGYASTYNVKILNSINTELHLRILNLRLKRNQKKY